MAEYTENLNLKKPATTDNVKIADINDNMDIIDEEVGALKEDLSQVSESIVEISKTVFGISSNLIDKRKVVRGEYVSGSKGTFLSNANFWRTDFLRVEPNTEYTLKYINQLMFYREDTNASYISGRTDYSTDTSAEPITVTSPSDARYIVVCGHINQLDTDKLVKGTDLDIEDIDGLVDDVKNLSSDLEVLTERVDNIKVGDGRISEVVRKIFDGNAHIKIIGDSTTAGQGGTGYTNEEDVGELIYSDTGYGTYYTNPNGHCWANSLRDYLTDKFNATVKVFGCSGVRMYRMKTFIQNLISEDDEIVILMGGLNDRNDNSAHETPQILFDSLKTIIDYCISQNKLVLFMSPIPTLDADTGTKNFTVEDISHVYKRLAYHYGIEYVPLFEKLNSFVTTSKSDWSNYLNTDKLHPNDNGYDVIYHTIMECLGIGVMYNHN